jgi:hypothetical protein
MSLERRQLNALVLGGVGMLLALISGPLEKTFSNAPSLVLAGIVFLSPLGVILFVLAVYRYATKDKESRKA